MEGHPAGDGAYGVYSPTVGRCAVPASVQYLLVLPYYRYHALVPAVWSGEEWMARSSASPRKAPAGQIIGL